MARLQRRPSELLLQLRRYFSNFVLLGSFLGVGLGFLIARRSWTILPAAPVILAVLVMATLAAPVTIDRAGDQIIYFTSLGTSGPPAWLALPLIFVFVAAALAGPAEVVGRCFAELAPLTAYRWDLVGSVLGITSFTLLSFLQAPSVVWGCWRRSASWRSVPVGRASWRSWPAWPR